MPFRGQEPPRPKRQWGLNPAPPDAIIEKFWNEDDVELDQLKHRVAERRAAREQYESPIMTNEREQRAPPVQGPQDYPDNAPHKGPFNNPFGPGPNPPPLGPFQPLPPPPPEGPPLR